MIGDFFHRTCQFLRRRAVGGPGALAPTGRREDSARPAGPSFVCENLEPRLLLSVYTVTNVNNAGAGSLRQALVDANANAGLDTITFHIAGSGIHTIVPTSVLPDITDPVIIDATSQPGYAGTPLIELNGTRAGNNRAGLTLESGSGGSTIRGLAINRFGDDGIHVTRSSGNLIEYNFIGTDPSGRLALGNGGDGIQLYFSAANNVIRYNVISANARGISIGIGNTDNDNNIIQANRIGTDAMGTVRLGNATAGITIGFGSINTLIGGPEAGQGNVIAFNRIGIEFRQNSATGHSILGNSIFSNGSLGIDLGSDGVTANDPGDGDTGPNNRQNFPVLTSVQVVSGTEVIIIGSFNSTADSYFRIEFFANVTADGSGYGQGQRYLGFVNVATDSSGNAVLNAALTAAVAPGEFISATATRSDSTFSAFTDSSEFAQNVVAIAAVVHTPSVTDATTDEDTQTTSGLVISRNPADGAEVTHFKITGITNGTLYQNDGTTPIIEGSFITFAEGNAGLKFTPAVNFSGSGHFTIQASTSDSDAGLGGNTVVATITVNAVNDAPVLDLDADDSAGQAGADFATIFTEGGPAVGLADADAALSDVDSALLNSLTVTVTNLMDGAAESLAADTTGTSITASYDSGTGVLTLTGLDSVTNYQQVLRTISYHNASEDPDTAARSIRFVANDGARDSNVATAMVTIAAVNNAPVVNDQSFSVDENAANGTPVGTVVANDPDAGDHLTYSITAGNTGGAFALDAATGEITVANSAALDYETHPTFTLTVEVADSGTPGQTASATVTIHLHDVNEAPAINNQSFSVDENAANGTPVGTVVASDPDAGDHLIYAITAGNTGGAFALNSTTGEITVANRAALDYETHPTFTLTVEVTDSGTPGLAASATVTIHLHDVNEAPAINNQSFSVDENAANGTPVGTVVASDPDAGDHLTYSITAGNTGGAFTLDADTGEITVANPAALDYETHPTFTLTVEVTDSGTPGLTASATVTIHLHDVNEAPTINNQSFHVNENAANGTVVGTVIANDPDAGDRLTYSITAGNTGGAFALDAATGEITVANRAALDYETHPTFTLTVEVADSRMPGQTASATVTIHLNDVNEAPAINNQSFRVDENVANRTVVGTVVARDPDAADRLTYSITAGNTGGAFALNSTTGEITVANRAALDYETHPTFSVTVRVMDLGGLAAEGTVTVNLNGVNEAPIVLVPGYVFTLPAVPMVFRSADGTGVSIRDVDAGEGNIRMEVRVTNGDVTLAGTAGLTFVLGDGADDTLMIFTGTIAAVNAALEGMTFQPQPGYLGRTTLQVVVDDQGNSGTGGHLLDAGVVNILVGAAPRPPDKPEVPAPPEPDSPERELPPLDIPEPEVSQPDAEDLNEGTPEQPMPQVPTETPAVPDATTAAGVLRPQGKRSNVTPKREPVGTAGTPKETRSDDSSTPPADGNTRREQAAKPEERVPDHTDIKAESAAIAQSVHANRAMWSQVESMKGQMDRSAGMQQQQKAIAVGMATGMSVSFAAGYVIWLLRGGSLLASLLAATPLWKSFDPLPVLAFWEKNKKQRRRPGEKDRSNGEDERKLDELFGSSAGATPDASWRMTE
jgi:hypothetical protein